MEGQSPPLAIDLHRKSNAEHLVAYIKTHHESLLALLPPDTTCADLFGEVENHGHARMPSPAFRVRNSIPFMVGGRQGYGGMLCRAATRPSTVYGGIPVGLFGCPIIP